MRFSVLGAGSFGTAVANNLARRGKDVALWCRSAEQAQAINDNHRNPKRLKDSDLDLSLTAHSDLEHAVKSADGIIVAVPTQNLRDLLENIALLGVPVQGKLFLSLSKGIEISSGLMPHQVFEEMLPGCSFSALCGPSHAEEVVRDLPTAVIAASDDFSAALSWQNELNSPHFRVYTSSDVIGVEMGAAVKNVIAIAVGISHSLNFGDNARAALTTRGLAEIMRLGIVMGADPLTFAGLAGVGDLMATCYSVHSRNFRFGMAIGRGLSPEQAFAEIGEVVEGAYTAEALSAYAGKAGIELPISGAVHSILYEGASLKEVIGKLLFREPKPERR